jgi:hypothetical protein
VQVVQVSFPVEMAFHAGAIVDWPTLAAFATRTCRRKK